MLLIQGAKPQSWARLVNASELDQANRKALDDCRKAAVRIEKAQQCSITLTAAPKNQK